MSCDSGANKVSKLAGRIGSGISQLAGKRGFYAGLALGGAGLVGAGLVALARRQSAGQPSLRELPSLSAGGNGQSSRSQQIPQLPGRQSVSPMSRVPLSERCEQCGASGKPGLWYRIGGKAYCQDCASGAAQQADVDLTVPKPDIPAKQIMLRGAKNAGAAANKTGKPLPAEKRVETRLEQSRLRVLLPPDQTGGRPVPAVTNNGYVVLRVNTRDTGCRETGLAITPVMEVNKDGEVTEDVNRWGVTHVGTGVMLAYPYASPQEAQVLAGIMAQEDWTAPVEEMKPGQLKQVRETIKKFNQAVAAAKGRPHIDNPLDGQLVTAGLYGGVCRVIKDGGDTLLLMDQMGGRHEVRRDEIRLPTPGDYESSRVAMAFDPASEPEMKCPDCGISSHQAAGERWYKAGWKARCASCSSSFAMNNGYFLEEEVGEEALG
jgi:hypothetical protein